jgi:hypothetical protein
MMTLYEQIIAIYPTLNENDFGSSGTIFLQNDGNGDYIKSWTNSNPQPTQDEINAIVK